MALDDGLRVNDYGCGSLHAMSNERHRGAGPARPSTEGSKLLELRGHEERLRALRARRTDLEVERIVAGTELRAARAGSGPEVPGAAAGAVVDALDRLRRLESSHAARLAFIDTGARSHEDLLQRLQAGDDALAAWLGADRERAGAGGLRTAKRVLLLFCFAILALAVVVHLAFLVLLVPVGGAMSFLLWTGQDRAWRRMGARRRFESLRLEVPGIWTEDAVRARRHGLSLVTERVRERTSIPAREDDEAEEARLSADSIPLAPTCTRRWRQPGSRTIGSTNRRRRECGRSPEPGARSRRCKVSLRTWPASAPVRASARESIYRKLAREGEASPDGDASVDALEAGVERISRR